MHLKVTAKKEGFRRAGKEWSEKGTVIDTEAKEWTKEKVQILKDEPMLVVSELSTEEKKQVKAEAEAKKAAEDAAK